LELSTVVHGVESPVLQGAFQRYPTAVLNLHYIVLLEYYKTINIVLLGINGEISCGQRWRTTND